MISNILVLIRPERSNINDNFKKVFESVGDYVEELSHLYTIIKDRSVDLILIDGEFSGINKRIIRKIRMRAPMADIWEISQSAGFESSNSKELYNGTIHLMEGPAGVTGKIKKILFQRELLKKFGIVGLSDEMKHLAETIDRIAPTDVSVLVIGPSGTGKELVARAIHDNSSHRDNRFVAINCGALAEGILESELFGHEKGAFTGSIGRREGLFRQADNGTILLDEIGEAKPDIQVKLLRVLEDGLFYPVGSDQPARSNVRVIAATNRDLIEAIRENLFREDLYFRLGVVKITIPPLCNRRADIIPLLYYFAERENLKGFSDKSLDLLLRYDWPGNVRQLRNFIARMAALYPDKDVSYDNAEQFIAEQGLEQKNLPVVTGRTSEEAGHELIFHALLSLGNEVKMLKDLIVANLPAKNDFEASVPSQNLFTAGRTGSMPEMEKELIVAVLRETGGNRKEAARKLGIGERTLYRKLNKYNLN